MYYIFKKSSVNKTALVVLRQFKIWRMISSLNYFCYLFQVFLKITKLVSDTLLGAQLRKLFFYFGDRAGVRIQLSSHEISFSFHDTTHAFHMCPKLTFKEFGSSSQCELLFSIFCLFHIFCSHTKMYKFKSAIV